MLYYDASQTIIAPQSKVLIKPMGNVCMIVENGKDMSIKFFKSFVFNTD